MMHELVEHAGNTLSIALSGILFLLGLIGFIYFWRRERACTESAPGEIFQLVESVDNEGDQMFTSWARFEVAGQVYEVADHQASQSANHEIGQQVTLYYPPGQPELAFIGRWRSVRPFIIIILIGAAGLVAVTVYAIVWN